jgi:uncharacterized LabA/DUF88 family protein
LFFNRPRSEIRALDRAIVFVDGSNRYHGCVAFGLKSLGRLDFAKISRKLVQARQVDVQLAVDMVVMAERSGYDTAYLLSADVDFTPAVGAVMATSRRVFVASPLGCARLAGACTSSLRLRRGWFAEVSGP